MLKFCILPQVYILSLQVSWKVYLKYFKAIGGISTFFIFGLFILYNAGGIVSNIWLSQWTDDKLLRNTTLANTTEYQDKNYMYLGVYAALGIGQGNTTIIIIIKKGAPVAQWVKCWPTDLADRV